MVNKIHNKGFLVFLLIVVCLSIGYPILNHFYLKPKKWKDQISQGIIQAHKSKASREGIRKFSECIFEKFQARYGNVDKFPTGAEFSAQDKIDVTSCTVDYLIVDSIQKKEILEKLDSIKK